MTRTEIYDYIESARSQIEVNAQLYAVQKATFFILAKNKQESACLIKTWDGLDQYEELVIQLKARFIGAYDESFDAQHYDCSPDASIPDELNFRDLRCSVIPQDEVLAKLSDASLEPAVKTFYGNCLSQKAYQKHEQWFHFNISETARLINDLVATIDGQAAEALVRLKNDMEAKKIGETP